MSSRLTTAAILFLAPLLIAADDYTHSGRVAPKTGPDLSDFALFAVAALCVWFARRAMRARFQKRNEAPPPPSGD